MVEHSDESPEVKTSSLTPLIAYTIVLEQFKSACKEINDKRVEIDLIEFSYALQEALRGLNEAQNKERLQKLKESLGFWVQESLECLRIEGLLKSQEHTEDTNNEIERYHFNMGIDKMHKKAMKLSIIQEEQLLKWRLIRLSKSINFLKKSSSGSSRLADLLGRKVGGYKQLGFRKIWSYGHDGSAQRAMNKLAKVVNNLKISGFIRIALCKPKEEEVLEKNPEKGAENSGFYEIFGDSTTMGEDRRLDNSNSIISTSFLKEITEVQDEKAAAVTEPEKLLKGDFRSTSKLLGTSFLRKQTEKVNEDSNGFWSFRNILVCSVYAAIPLVVFGKCHSCHH